MGHYRRIEIVKGGKPIYSNEISNKKIVGEIELKKPQDPDICNICLMKKNLTYDHAPPQFMGNSKKIYYRNFFNYKVEKKIIYGHSNNGLKYKTICQKCNHQLGEYDLLFSDLFKKVIDVKPPAKIIRPYYIKPKMFIKSLCGHFLAAKLSHQRSVLDDLFYDIIMDTTNPKLNKLGFYIAPYFDDSIKVIRDVMIGKYVVNIMKIKPFAFIITYPKSNFNFHDWSEYIFLDDDYIRCVELFGLDECPVDFPENSLPIMLGLNAIESIIAYPRKNEEKKS